MAIYYADEHVNCSCYSGNDSPAIEIIEIPAHDVKTFYWDNNSICLLIEGSGMLFTDDHKEKPIQKGQFVFAPTDASCTVRPDKPCKIIVAHIPDNIRLCQSFDIRQLFENAKTDKAQLSLLKFSMLEMNDRLWDYAHTLTILLEDGLKCFNFLHMKVDELLLLLRAYYTKEELHDFFFYVLNPNSVFIDFVRRNWTKYKTIGEMAEGMNMSVQHFSKRFKEIFKQSPGSWMQEQKAQLILSEIRAGVKSFKQISDDFGFSAQSHFNRFCNQMLGGSPNELRKGSNLMLQEKSILKQKPYIQVAIPIKVHGN